MPSLGDLFRPGAVSICTRTCLDFGRGLTLRRKWTERTRKRKINPVSPKAVPSGTSLAADLTKISELHAMRLKPDRSFQMKTAMSRVYSVTNIQDQSDTQINDYDETIPRGSADTYRDECANQKHFKISTVNVRNHEFDIRAAGIVKHGILKKIGQQPRGVQSVRSHYKVDESKILPSVSLNLPDDVRNIVP